MKNLIRLIVCISAIGAPEPFLKKVADMWLINGYNLNDYAIAAANYTGEEGEPVWVYFSGEWVYRGLSDRYYFSKGQATRTIDVHTKTVLRDGVWFVEAQIIDTHTEIKFLPPDQVAPIVVPDPNDIIVRPEPFDPNTLLSIIDGRIEQDPNDPSLQILRNLLTGEIK